MPYLTLRDSFDLNKDSLPPVTANEIEKYDRHFLLLQQWNERINLVSRKSIGSAFEYHYADSLHMAHLSAEYSLPYFDVGTGAGFPGIIAAIHLPHRSFTLFEKSTKKRTFLSAAISQLKLENVRLAAAIPTRGAKGFYFARAVFQREDLFRRMGNLLPSGSFLAVSSGGENSDHSASKKFVRVTEVKYCLPLQAGSRRFEIYKCST